MQKILLVSIVIGDAYQKNYAQYYYENHQSYAKQCGYDFTVCTDFIDPNNQHTSFISFQKILVCSGSESLKYDYIVVVDADILFNLSRAEPIHENIKSPEKIYIVDEFCQPSYEKRIMYNIKYGYERSASEYYAQSGLHLDTNLLLNTGVMIFNPQIHKDFLEKIYIEGLKKGLNHPRGFHYEQSLVGYYLQKEKMYSLLPTCWNAIFALQNGASPGELTLSEFYRKNKAIHFAGGHVFESSIPELIKSS